MKGIASIHPCALILICFISGCLSASKIADPFGVDSPLPSGTPESVGMDEAILSAIHKQLSSDDHKIHSMLVARHGLLIHEEYYNGWSETNPHDLRSATKSITSLITGIAIGNGLLDLTTPVLSILGDDFPDAKVSHDLNIRHLLTMQTGLDCDDSDKTTKGQEDRMYRSTDWTDYFLSLNQVENPGTLARYCTGGVVALGAAIAASAGTSIAAFAESVLFRPLGINNYTWAYFNSGKGVDTGGHLLLTPRAMAKIGILVLLNGTWEGHSLVPQEWIDESTSQHTEINGNPYGYLWWINTISYGEKSVEVVSARGNGGQVIFIAPEYDLVSVFTAGYYNSDKTQSVYDIFHRGVLPAVEDLKPHLSGKHE